MDSLQVRTGQVSLRILDDAGMERGIFKFNPEDIESAKRVVAIQDELDAKGEEFEIKRANCKSQKEEVGLLEEIVDYFRGLVDNCFGEGTSNLVFGDAKSLTMFSDFFEGITPYYQEASKKRMEKYAKYTKPSKAKK